MLLLASGHRADGASPLNASVKLQMREGHPLVRGVYINGHGPYRFLLDTGSTLNHLDPKLAQAIGLTATFRSELRSAVGVISVPGAEGLEVTVDTVRADRQTFLFAGLEVIQASSPDIQGILGQAFLSRFDYLLDMRAERLAFGKLELDGKGTRVAFRSIAGRPVVSTSLGSLVLDSGADLVVRFGVTGTEATLELVTLAGSVNVRTVASQLLIEGRIVWRGDAVALPRPAAEGNAAGLLPTNVFRSVYVCNSEGYVVFDAR
jgi:hypothetical protein